MVYNTQLNRCVFIFNNICVYSKYLKCSENVIYKTFKNECCNANDLG